jgi:uncharacterized damage-inducible protein DinB
MATPEREQLIVEPLSAADPAIGRALWCIEEARLRTRERLTGLDPQALDWLPADGVNSIGTLLYHIAAIEADWLYVEALERPIPPEVAALFPYEVREEDGRLTPVTGRSLAEHDALLDEVRALLLGAYLGMALAEYRRPRQLERYDVTPEWVLHHLMQHEAEHRGELSDLRRRAEAADFRT